MNTTQFLPLIWMLMRSQDASLVSDRSQNPVFHLCKYILKSLSEDNYYFYHISLLYILYNNDPNPNCGRYVLDSKTQANVNIDKTEKPELLGCVPHVR